MTQPTAVRIKSISDRSGELVKVFASAQSQSCRPVEIDSRDCSKMPANGR
jgi:hypothetical protein